MNNEKLSFKFTDLSGEKYVITFGIYDMKDKRNTCTIVTYPNKWDNKTLAMCSFYFNNKIITSDNEAWVVEYISPETLIYFNKLIKNLIFA